MTNMKAQVSQLMYFIFQIYTFLQNSDLCRNKGVKIL